MPEREYTRKPEYARTYLTGRAVIVGLCPACRQVLVLFNNHEAWPLVDCNCGWTGSTHDIDRGVRFDNGGFVEHQDARYQGDSA